MPRVETWVEWDSRQDDVFVEQSNVEGTLLVQRPDGPLTYELLLQAEHEEDDRTGVERDRWESIVRGTYQDTHLDGDLEVRVGVFLNARDQTSRFPSGVTIGLPPDEVVPAEGLAEIDPTPELGTLATNAALIDGDEDTPAGVNIGGVASGGQPDWNIGLRSAQPRTVDLIVLTTEEEVIPFLWPDFTFSAWVSDDGQLWDLVTSDAVFSYEAAFRRFRILLPPATGRYFKVVAAAVPATADAIWVTEIRAFEPSTIVPAWTYTSPSAARRATTPSAPRPLGSAPRRSSCRRSRPT